MQVVERPGLEPGYCIATLSSEDPRGFVDTGLSPAVIDPRIYVSAQAIIDMGRLFGLPSPEEHAVALEKIAELGTRVEQLEEDNINLERDVQSAEWTLERQFATKIQNKPGRPRKAQ